MGVEIFHGVGPRDFIRLNLQIPLDKILHGLFNILGVLFGNRRAVIAYSVEKTVSQ